MVRTLLWVVAGIAGLIVVGAVVMSVVGALLKLFAYLLVGVLVVGAAMVLVGRSRKAVRGGRPRQIKP
jgi:uncharacterized membrane protein YdfJ with MMPL/SSD domain